MKVFTLAFKQKKINLQPDNTPLTLIAEAPNSTVTLLKSESPAVDGLQYKTNKSTTWQQYTIDTEITLTNIGDFVQFQNTKTELSSSDGYVYFVMEGKIKAIGNIQSMLNYSDELTDYCYDQLFYGCNSLTAAPKLPATKLANYCYRSMFAGCSSLTAAPELPATALAEGCYHEMFYYCTSLATAPKLDATTLTDNCYSNMFCGCTSLTTAPELPATKLAYCCYQYMFAGCSSLTAAPELPATTLAEYCYYSMFINCSNLNYIKVGFTDWDNAYGCTIDWVHNVATNGTFECPSTLNTSVTGGSGIPVGWTVQTGSSQEQPPAEDNDTVGEASGITISGTNDQLDGNYYLQSATVNPIYRVFKNIKEDNSYSWIQFIGSNGQGTWFINNRWGNTLMFAEGTGNETIEEICKLNWMGDFANFTITPCYQNNNSDDPVETPDDPLETPVNTIRYNDF